jgi:RNA-directed DNA polymerase
MKESCGEGLAIHTGPESCVGVRKDAGEALTGVRTGRVLSREIHAPPRGGLLRGADAVESDGRQHSGGRKGETSRDPARSETPCMYGRTLPGNREVLSLAAAARCAVRIGKPQGVRR